MNVWMVLCFRFYRHDLDALLGQTTFGLLRKMSTVKRMSTSDLEEMDIGFTARDMLAQLDEEHPTFSTGFNEESTAEADVETKQENIFLH